MIVSALLGGWTDAQFSLRGYAWQLVNCLLTAAYSLYLSGVIRKLLKQQHGKQQLGEMSMVSEQDADSDTTHTRTHTPAGPACMLYLACIRITPT